MPPVGWFAFLAFYFFPVLGLILSLVILCFRGSWKTPHPRNRTRKIALLLYLPVTFFLALAPMLYFFIMCHVAAELGLLSPWTNVFYAYVWLGPLATLLLFVFAILALKGRQKKFRWVAIVSLFVALWSTYIIIWQRTNSVVHKCEEIYSKDRWFEPFSFMKSDNPRCISIYKAAGGSIHENLQYETWPLHKACEYGKKKVVEKLLAEGADLEAREEYARTPLYMAVKSGNRELVRFLIKKGADIHTSSYGNNLLFPASLGENPRILSDLLELGLDINQKDIGSWTPLHEAASWDRAENVEILLAAGACVDATGKFNRRPLYIAALHTSIHVVRVLLEHGADINAQEEGGGTPLHLAAVLEPAMARYLISRGADIHIRDKWGWTPMHYAAKFTKLDTIQLLLSHGASVSVLDCTGATPLDIACDKHFSGRSDVHIAAAAACLLSNGATHSLFSAIAIDDASLVGAIISGSPEINLDQPVAGEIPLHAAAKRGCTKAAKVLLKSGANVNLHDANGTTALMQATDVHDEYGSDMINLLTDWGAKPKVTQ
jgi:ankyrin repeat protein